MTKKKAKKGASFSKWFKKVLILSDKEGVLSLAEKERALSLAENAGRSAFRCAYKKGKTPAEAVGDMCKAFNC